MATPAPIVMPSIQKHDLPMHQHGKARVRVARAWRDPSGVHHFVEWTVHTMLESAMEHSFFTGSNAGMTATDTQKNTVYVVAKRCSERCTPEEYSIALAQHFLREYPLVSKAKIAVEQKPWTRAQLNGVPHNHGFEKNGTETRTVYTTLDRANNLEVTAGVRDYQVLKTTQSGYGGFLHDKYTLLPDTNERILATSLTVYWKYGAVKPRCYESAFQAAKQALQKGFFGPPKSGVYSPAVQYTVYDMGSHVLDAVPEVEHCFLNAPNLHFLPCTPPTHKFDNDVYVATSEPHGDIECVVRRKGNGKPYVHTPVSSRL
mmetsp:Transcript_21583/g.59835  ORF Transcript_21583/g.59835 Transcript_21583/m.59835 type:complete len:316 (-) Transcript_21583:1079-2026(-)|eukprot:CAMPEP_0202349250 /NCGR_PEP_ID=MMETSP1126-20121109/6819_1 /ASSEMBLY_ACC=CAM_ASM_000457 /TAXON_ID=3047 /ORGANISM="Dunaliella tertiolecta, Strain CCMP1320" /LENGTH=315 /DNA_ID=CAMNT_0048941027 /DNA_START=119 /DNA_END=1066 /DNA_ORIENTATION=-